MVGNFKSLEANKLEIYCICENVAVLMKFDLIFNTDNFKSLEGEQDR